MGKQRWEDGDRWDGGYVHLQTNGRPLFIIERRIRGKRYHISTRAHSETAAIEQLKLFEGNPDGYARGEHIQRPSDGMFLSVELVQQFREWQVAKGNTAKYVSETTNRLADWAEDLKGLDLRKVTVARLKEALDRRRTCRQHRIIAIKVLYKWLRTEKHTVKHHEDPTPDLMVPQGQPEKWTRRKVVPFEHVKAAAAQLAPDYRDCLQVLAGTGLHVTELERMVRNPESGIFAGRDHVLGVLVVRHKIGELTRVPITDPDVLAAANRLRERGTVPRRLNQAVKEACLKAGVPEFTLGVMRHSVATWAVEMGADPLEVSRFLNHKDERTSKRFYIDLAIPTNTVPLPKLG